MELKDFLMRRMTIVCGFLKAYAQSLVLAFIWLLFMVFFTYTTLVVEMACAEGNFCELFYQEQSRYIALFVNVGIVAMLLFDNHVAKQPFRGVSYYIPFVSLVFCLIIMAHCEANVNHCLDKYIQPISWEYLSIIAYGCFLFMVYIMKVRALSNSSVQKKGVN